MAVDWVGSDYCYGCLTNREGRVKHKSFRYIRLEIEKAIDNSLRIFIDLYGSSSQSIALRHKNVFIKELRKAANWLENIKEINNE